MIQCEFLLCIGAVCAEIPLLAAPAGGSSLLTAVGALLEAFQLHSAPDADSLADWLTSDFLFHGALLRKSRERASARRSLLPRGIPVATPVMACDGFASSLFAACLYSGVQAEAAWASIRPFLGASA